MVVIDYQISSKRYSIEKFDMMEKLGKIKKKKEEEKQT